MLMVPRRVPRYYSPTVLGKVPGYHSALFLAAGIAWFPRGSSFIADAEREARALVSEETARESPIS
jgi:hypothetical protein